MSADSDMVERVARAICEADGKRWRTRDERPSLGLPHDYDFDALNSCWRHKARAALDASGIGELVDAAYEFQCAVHMNASTRTLEVADRRLTAALSRARATQEKIDGPQSASVASLEKDANVSNNSGVSANAEKRFFIEHGMIHDRVTGKHVSTEPIEFEEGQFDASPTIETCALLNQLCAAVGDSRDAQPPSGDS